MAEPQLLGWRFPVGEQSLARHPVGLTAKEPPTVRRSERAPTDRRDFPAVMNRPGQALGRAVGQEELQPPRREVPPARPARSHSQDRDRETAEVRNPRKLDALLDARHRFFPPF